jgi:hypothetical protein
MPANTIDRNVAILQSLFFVRGNPVKHKLNRSGDNVSTKLPLTKTGAIQDNPGTKKPYFRVGLESTLIDSGGDPAPSNLQPITVTSVAIQGRLFADLDKGLDKLPDLFFNSLGVVNDEIEAENGGGAALPRSLMDILGAEPKPKKKPTSAPKTQSPGKITAKDLEQLGLDIERLEEMGLSLEVLNERGLKLSDLEQILGN